MKIHRGIVTTTTPLSDSLTRVTLGGEGIAEFLSRAGNAKKRKKKGIQGQFKARSCVGGQVE